MLVQHLPLSYDRRGSFSLADVLRTASDAKESQHRRCRESEFLHRTLPCHDERRISQWNRATH
jgi:hypothetical protein